MKSLSALTVRQLFFFILSGMATTLLLLAAAMAFLFRNPLLLAAGLLFGAASLFWCGLFLYFTAQKLDDFSASVCAILDRMTKHFEKTALSAERESDDGSGFLPPESGLYEETLFSRISHHLGRLYEMLYENRQALARQKESLESLISDISHQTHSVTGSLQALNETLADPGLPADKRAAFFRMQQEQTGKLDFLIRSLLKASRLENGMISLQKENCPLCETLVQSLNSVLTGMEAKKIRFSMDCPDSLCFPHDRRWTAEAVCNLLDNAVKYTPCGGSISVSVEKWELFVKITVADNGPGIPETEQAAVFKRFYRGSQTRSVDGLGLGLYLAREIVTRQGGYMLLVSEPGNGAAFQIFLPL